MSKTNDKNTNEIKSTKFFSPHELDEECENTFYHQKQKEIFKNEVFDLIDKNKCLVAKVDEQKYEIAELKCKIDALNDIINSEHLDIVGRGSSIASNKIMDLSKRNRQLTADLELFKSKCSSLEQSNKLLEIDYQEKMQAGEMDFPPENELQSQIDSLQSKLSCASFKLCDVLSQNSTLKNELKIAQKCLQQEIGENISIADIAQNNSNWRGRAQQICNLKSKLSDLKLKLSDKGIPEHKCKGKKPEPSKLVDADALKAELATAKQTIEDLNFKISALKARGKILNEDSAACKAKTLLLMDRSKLDEEYIKELNDQITCMKKHHCNTLKEMGDKLCMSQKEKDELKIQLTQLVLRVENSEITESYNVATIDRLKDRIQELESDLRAIAGDFLFSCREFKKSHYVGLLEALEQEKAALLENVRELNLKIDNEKEKYTDLRNQFKALQIRYCRSEEKSRELTEKLQDKPKKKLMSKILSKDSSLDAPPPSPQSERMESKFEELNYRLEISDERIKLLRERIEELEEAKASDLKKITGIIQNSKNLMVECLRKQLSKDRSAEEDGDSSECSFEATSKNATAEKIESAAKVDLKIQVSNAEA